MADLLDGAAHLEEILREENRLRTQKTKVLQRYVRGLMGFTFVAAIVGWVRTGTHDILPYLGLLPLLGGGIAFGVSDQHKLTAKAAAELQDLRLLGPLLDVLDSGDKALVGVAKAAILELSGRIHGPLPTPLTDAQIRAVHAWIQRETSIENVTKLAYILGVSGNLDSISVLERLKALGGAVPTARRSEVKTIALQRLGDLRLRLASEIVHDAMRKQEEASNPLPNQTEE